MVMGGVVERVKASRALTSPDERRKLVPARVQNGGGAGAGLAAAGERCYPMAMTASLETLLAPIRHSPQLVEAVDLLQEQIHAERQRRTKFYEEMTPEQKIEFIDGEVVLHSPARNVHLDVTSNVALLFSRDQFFQSGKSTVCWNNNC